MQVRSQVVVLTGLQAGHVINKIESIIIKVWRDCSPHFFKKKQNMFRFSKCIFFAVLFLAACKKGEPVNEFYFASFTAELLELPGTETVDVYVNNVKVDTLAPGKIIGLSSPLMLSAGKPATIVFKKTGTDSLLLDTAINASAGAVVSFKLAYSPSLGIQTFMTAGDNVISADSASFFLYNQLPVEIQADDVKLDAYLFKSNGVDFEETGIVWKGFEKNKLHPTPTTLLVTENGAPIQYILKFKNTETGEFLLDKFSSDQCPIDIIPGKRQIMTVSGKKLIGRWKYASVSTEY